jgi:Ni,Fe-hydrogenase maturation factor
LLRVWFRQQVDECQQLAKRVAATPGAVEHIEHRDLPEHLAPTAESHIRFLETMVAELKRLTTRPFSLEGRIRSKLPDGELEASLNAARKEQADRAVSRIREILGGRVSRSPIPTR